MYNLIDVATGHVKVVYSTKKSAEVGLKFFNETSIDTGNGHQYRLERTGRKLAREVAAIDKQVRAERAAAAYAGLKAEQHNK
jgi:hypothetical protein